MTAKGLAASVEYEGHQLYLIDPGVHERLIEVLAERALPLRAASAPVLSRGTGG
jgi:hypothetical protein